jgi:hypothetical protein
VSGLYRRGAAIESVVGTVEVHRIRQTNPGSGADGFRCCPDEHLSGSAKPASDSNQLGRGSCVRWRSAHAATGMANTQHPRSDSAPINLSRPEKRTTVQSAGNGVRCPGTPGAIAIEDNAAKAAILNSFLDIRRESHIPTSAAVAPGKHAKQYIRTAKKNAPGLSNLFTARSLPITSHLCIGHTNDVHAQVIFQRAGIRWVIPECSLSFMPGRTASR